MSEQPKSIKGNCPSCHAERNAEIVASYKLTYEEEDGPDWDSTDYRVLKCKGCDRVYFQSYSLFSYEVEQYYDNRGNSELRLIPTIKYWPSPIAKVRPEWLDKIHVIDGDLYNLLNEVYIGLDNNLNVLAAIGIRTAFDRGSELLGISPRMGFGQKLDELLKKQFIGQGQKEALDILTDAGSAAAHRGWKPSLDQLKTLINVIEQFIHQHFILNNEVKTIKPNIPKR